MKRLFKFIKVPPLWFLIIIAAVAVCATVGATIFMTNESLSAYIVAGYVFIGVMVATVGYCIYGFIKIFPDLNERVLKWSEGRPFWNRLVTEYGFRTIILSTGSLAISLAFAVYNGSVAVRLRSIWFGALAAYYILLILLRGIILLYHLSRRKAVKAGQAKETTFLKDTRIYLVCGIVLLLLPVALSFAILQMVRENNSFVHSGITIYVYAIYAFYKITASIVSCVKTRRTNEMTLRATKNIALSDAMVSILALQTAMFREFDASGDVSTVAVMNAATGAVVCLLTATLGIIMIIIAAKVSRRHSSSSHS